MRVRANNIRVSTFPKSKHPIEVGLEYVYLNLTMKGAVKLRRLLDAAILKMEKKP